MKVFEFIKDVKAELKHVNWPKNKVAIGYTVLVILVSIFVAIFLGFFDYLFIMLEKMLIS